MKQTHGSISACGKGSKRERSMEAEVGGMADAVGMPQKMGSHGDVRAQS